MRLLLSKKLIEENNINIITLMTTTLAPTGVAYKNDITIPHIKHETDKTAEQITTEWKFLNKRIEVSGGKIIRLDISSAPIKRIPKTIVTAVNSAISILYNPALIPVARAKLSSKVTTNILL